MAGAGETAHIHPDFGNENLGNTLVDAWNGIQERHGLPTREWLLATLFLLVILSGQWLGDGLRRGRD